MSNGIKIHTPESLAKNEPRDKLSVKGKIEGLIESRKDAIARALPKMIDQKRFIQIVMTCVGKNPELLKCTEISLLGSILTAAQVGLELDPVFGQAYLIPYWNKDKKCHEAQFQAGYKGLIELALRSEKVISITAQVIYEGDEWRYEHTSDGDSFVHKPVMDNDRRGNPVGAWARAKLKDGFSQFDVMTTGDIEAIRQAAPSANSPAWRNHWSEMAKKTVVKRMAKYLPVAAELHKYSAQEDALEGGFATIDISGGEPLVVPTDAVGELTTSTEKSESKKEGRGQPPKKAVEPEKQPVFDADGNIVDVDFDGDIVDKETGEVRPRPRDTGEPSPKEKAEIEARERAEASAYAGEQEEQANLKLEPPANKEKTDRKVRRVKRK